MPSGVSEGARDAGVGGIAVAKSPLAKFGMRVMIYQAVPSPWLAIGRGARRAPPPQRHSERYQHAVSCWTYIMPAVQRRQPRLAAQAAVGISPRCCIIPPAGRACG